MRGSIMRIGAIALSLMALAPIAGCADGPQLPKFNDLNPFAEKVVPLPGRRISVMPEQQEFVTGELSDASAPIVLPAQRLNDSWPQPGGTPNNAPGNLAYGGALTEAWSADAGKGSGNVNRLTASPVVAGDRIYTLDAVGTVTAFPMSGGSPVWRVNLKPQNENTSTPWYSFSLGGGSSGNAGYGGGLAIDNGRVYAASGFGNVVALDPQTGRKLWEKQLEAPIRSSPTAAADRVFVITLDGRFYCLAGADGAELWSVRGLPQQASLITNASPAVEGDIVVVPYPSGDLVALKITDGSSVWSESLSRTRTTSQLTSMSDAARPVIDNGTVFAIGHAGRMVATHAGTGERVWSLNIPGMQPPWVAGDSVFVVDTNSQLLAVSRRDGKVQWTAKLPADSWCGPTLAGNTLWLASAKGTLVGVEASTGRITTQKELGSPIYVAPIFAQGKMFIITDKARLVALN
jgi:outer membrane protein assembly factor BamB